MNELPIEGMKITPTGWPKMGQGYLGCVSWAMGREDIRAAFTEETGHDLTALSTANPLERMIDGESGRTRAMMAAFCDWVSLNIWGIDE